MKLLLTYILLACTILPLLPNSSEAQRVYRCHGLVQHRPCGAAPATSEIVSQAKFLRQGTRTHSDARFQLRTGPFARVVEKNYRRLGPKLGHFRGYVEGNGLVRLTLKILRNGGPAVRKLIGSVHLDPGEKPVLFSFQSSVPPGSGWQWQISAVAL